MKTFGLCAKAVRDILDVRTVIPPAAAPILITFLLETLRTFAFSFSGLFVSLLCFLGINTPLLPVKRGSIGCTHWYSVIRLGRLKGNSLKFDGWIPPPPPKQQNWFRMS